VTLLRVHRPVALGGKGFLMMASDVSSVQVAAATGSEVVAKDGMPVGRCVIPAPLRGAFPG
jgi:microcompartment protein CcmL/EutN